MARTMFTGVHVPLVTPFGPDGELNAPALKQLIDWVIDNGASGVVPCGTTGESPTLSHEEHHRVIALTVEYAAGRVPVIAGTGSNCTREAIDLTVAADELGVDGMLVIAPYYNRPNQAGVLEHFTAVAAATEKPIIIYNIPKRTGINIEASTLIELSKVPNITGVKEASGDLAQIMEIIERTEEFSVLTGDDNLLFSTDYPHGDSQFPHAVDTFDELDLSEATKAKICGPNWERLYRIPATKQAKLPS